MRSGRRSSSHLRGLGRLVGDDEIPEFQARVRDLVRPALADLGDPRPDESDLDAKLRGLLLGTVGGLGNDTDVVAVRRGAR